MLSLVRDRPLSRFFLKISLVLLCLSLGLTPFTLPSEASIRRQEEAPGQILYQSRQSLRDQNGQPWQVILFKRVKAGVVDRVDLRLVGYPDQVKFSHPAPLAIAFDQQQHTIHREAADQFATRAPAPNVGQFDLQPLLSTLPSDRPITLHLPSDRPVTLEIPPAVVLEWHLVQ